MAPTPEPKVAPKVSPALPVASKSKPKVKLNDVLNLSLILVVGLGLAYSAWVGWQAERLGSGASITVPTLANQSSSVSVPDLQLNTPHQRQGAVVSPDPGNLGKDNPFAP